jgi:tetratricopeptide (TPR) repeat protein
MDWYGISDFDKAIQHFMRALEIDPDYMRARQQIAMAYGTMGEIDKALATLKPLLENREKFTRYERLTLSWCEYWLQYNDAEALRILRELEKLAPADVFTLFLIGGEELLLNRPQRTVDTYAKIDPKIMYREIFGAAWILPLLASAHHLLGNFKKELKEIGRGLKHFPDLLKLRRSEICALAALGRINEVKKVLDERATVVTQGQIQAEHVLVAARELRAHGFKKAATEVANEAIERYKMQSSQADFRYNLARVFYMAERWDEAKALFEELNLEKSDNIHYMGYLGVLAARRKDREEAHRISTKLQELDKPFLFGKHTYWRACIASLMGEHHRAVELLRAAIGQGYAYGLHLHRNMDFEPLKDYPPFQQLIGPRE